MSAARRIENAVVVPASAQIVWERAVTMVGINHEMGPWVRMTLPRAVRHLTVDTVPLGQPLGRAYLRFLGVLPFDYDRLVIVEVEPGQRFLERSTMLAMRRWEHERILTPVAGGTRVTDSIVLEPRRLLRPAAGLLAGLINQFFRHRHRRLSDYWA